MPTLRHAALAAAVASALLGTTPVAGQAPGNGTALTIYSTARPGALSPDFYRMPGRGAVPGYAMVRQERDLELAKGRNAVRFADVAALIDPTTVAFESLTDSESVTTQFTGLTFSNAVALQAGASLNDVEFPPRSGSKVISDDGGPMTVSFTAPVTAVGAYFTYGKPVTLTAFDVLDNVLGNVTSAFNINTAQTGDPGSAPNEFLELSFTAGIARLSIAGDAAGSSFVLDDLTVTSAVPEPYSATLALIGLAGLLTMRRRGSE